MLDITAQHPVGNEAFQTFTEDSQIIRSVFPGVRSKEHANSEVDIKISSLTQDAASNTDYFKKYMNEQRLKKNAARKNAM